MKRNFSLLFFLKKRNTDQNGITSVYLRLTVDKQRVEAATGKQCKEKKWDNGKFKGRTEKAKTLNLYLHQLELKVQEAHRQIFIRDEELTAQTLLDEFHGKYLDELTSKPLAQEPQLRQGIGFKSDIV